MVRFLTVSAFLVLLFAGSSFAITSHEDFAEFPLDTCEDCHDAKDAMPTHGEAWINEHRLFSEKKPSNCIDCHDQAYCTDCHFGGGIDADLNLSTSGPDYMPKSHRSDFREIHPIKMLDNPKSCYRCHDNKRFCSDCHDKFNAGDLNILSHRKGFSDLEVSAGGSRHSSFPSGQCETCHPNSILPKHEWSNSHAREARKNLASCESCHPEGNVCIQCHSSITGLKSNPHPKGWDKISGKLERASNRRTCARCHP